MPSALPPRTPDMDFRTPEQRSEDIRLLAKSSEDTRRAEEAKLEAAKLKSGVAIPPPMAPMDAITMEVAMSSDTATVSLQFLVDPFLPSRCVVGFFGRGSTAKSSLVATLAAQVSGEASTLWISVEEPNDWIRVRHMKIGGDEGTLFVVTAVANKSDTQGRVTGSNFDVYEHLETAIQKAKRGADTMYIPPRPLKLVVLDTAVGLTGWRKGESPNDDASVKKLLAYLQALAERYDVTIAFIGHANKAKHDYFADTVAGASAWTKVLPSVKAQAEKVQFDLNTDAPISEQVAQVLDAIAAGAIAPDVGRLIIDSVARLSDVRATEELAARIEALEEARDARA